LLGVVELEPVVDHAVDVAVLAGQYHRPAGGADGIGHETVVKQYAFFCQAVDVGRLVDLGSVGADRVRGMIVGEDEVRYFCARVSYSEVERVTIEGSNLTMETTGTYWLSSDAGTVRQEAATTYYVNGVFSGTERRTLVLTSIRKGQG